MSPSDPSTPPVRPSAIGPYSQAVVSRGRVVTTAGQIALDAEIGRAGR